MKEEICQKYIWWISQIVSKWYLSQRSPQGTSSQLHYTIE